MGLLGRREATDSTDPYLMSLYSADDRKSHIYAAGLIYLPTFLERL